MKKILFIFSAALMIASCSNDEANEVAVPATAKTVKAPTGLADFKLSAPSQSVMEGSYMDLINTSKNAKSYFWEFGDGQTSTEKAPSHLYPLCGFYNLKLTVTDGNGQKTSYDKQVTVVCTIAAHQLNQIHTSGS